MKKIFFSSFIMLFATLSCDVLDLTPTDSFTKEDAFGNEKLLSAYVGSLYNGVRNALRERRFQDALTDNAYHTHDFGTWPYVTGAVNVDNGESVTRNLWSHSYEYIRNINLFFDNIEASPVDDEVKKRLTAEVRFIRAYIYAELIRWYGGVPIIEELFTANDDFSDTPRKSYDDVVAYIVRQLDDDVMSELPEKSADGRASVLAVKALKSRVLLYAASILNNPSNDREKWEAAKAATKEAIDLAGDDALYKAGADAEESYAEVFKATTPESIWVRLFTNDNSNNVIFQNAPNGYPGGGGSVPLQSLIDAYEMRSGSPITEPGSGYDPQNPYVNRDPRFYATINYNGARWKQRDVETFTGGKDTQAGIQPWNTSKSGYYVRKWLDEDTPADWLSEGGRGHTTWIYFRIAELYLNYAEIWLALGDEAQAKIWMNKTRERVGMPPITATGNDLTARYRNERRIELAYENHRFFDILRWEIAKDVLANKMAMGVTITKNESDLSYDYSREVQARDFYERQYRLPIPRGEIDKSGGTLTQNEDYN